MPYSTRNTIALLIIIVLVLIGIYFINHPKSGELKAIRAKNQKMKKRLKNLENSYPNLDDPDRVLDELHKLEKKSLANNKLIPDQNNPVITYQYLLKICDHYCPSIKFNFNILNKGTENDVPYNSYSINGTSNVFNLYRLIYQLETQQLLMTIESLKLSPVSKKGVVTDTVDYQIKFNAYHKNNGTNLEDIPFRTNNNDHLSSNFFQPEIHKPDISKLDPSLANVEKSNLIGLTENIVFLSTNNSKVVELSTGDRVAFGYLKKIDLKNKRAIFIINKIGIYEKLILEFKKD